MLSVLAFIVGLILLFLVGLAFSYPTIIEIFNLRRTPIIKIGTLPAEGLVQVVGKAEQATAISPIGQTKCVVWKAQVAEQHSGGKWGTYWDTLWEGKSTPPFELCDGTGTVWVDPTHADLFLQKGVEEESGWISSLTPKTLEAITSLGVKTKGLLGIRKDLKVTESLLSTGKEIFVMGTVESSDGQKMIKLVDHNPFVVSYHGKDALLTQHYKEVATWFILITLIGGGLLFAILFVLPGSGMLH